MSRCPDSSLPSVSNLSDTGIRAPMPHQKEAFKKFKDLPYCILFMEMRLGKSMVAIRWAKRKKPNMVLILSPVSAMEGWVEELLKEQIEDIEILRSGKYFDKFRENVVIGEYATWNIITHELLRSCPSYGFAPWDVIIVDESTKIKNPTSQITKTLLTIAKYIPNRCILSGLPNPESMLDYFTQFQFALGRFLGYTNYWYFRSDFFTPDFSGYGFIPKKDTREKIKNFVHEIGFSKTRKQCKIGSKKIYEKYVVDMPPALRKIENRFLQTWDYAGKETKQATEVLIWRSRISSGFSPDEKLLSDFKLKEMLQLWKHLLGRQKTVFWFRFNREIEEASKLLQKEKIPHGIINGTVPKSRRDECRKEFTSGKTNIILCQIKCVKFGTNLSAADTAVYFSNSYSLEERNQSEDRIIHAMKKVPVLYIDMVTRDSVDTEVIDSLTNKKVDSKTLQMSLIKNIKRMLLHGKTTEKRT